ncbi:MAG: 2-hydroxyacyl-CoA dehydratase [Clostridia bacterium]|nr:2-hydroxyacyl-CoA dehydratase [Clostridia bacterium]
MDCSVNHKFKSADFTKQMKSTYKILAPNIFPMHMDLIQGIFKMYGYNLEVLKYEGRNIIDEGLKHIHNDMCYPAICMSGQQLYALTCGDYDPHKVALIQFQTGGGCRASNYIWMLRKALHNMNMDYVPVISLSFNRMEKSNGFKVTPMMIAKGLMAIVYGDMMMLLRNQIRPYEKNEGDTQRVVDKWNNELINQFSHNKGLIGRSLKNNLKNIVDDFSKIERKNIKKTKVGIVGEIYVKYSQFGNNGLEAFLDSQDCEYMVPGVIGFFQFMFDNIQTDYELYGGKYSSKLFAKLAERVAAKMENYMLDALKDYPCFVAPSKFEKIRRLGDKVIGRGVKMGEGWLLPAEIAELIENGYNNIICAQPFGCLPNHIVGKGTIRTLRELYPQANICPIDYDSSASKVNQENRIKLMLSVARENEENEACRN